MVILSECRLHWEYGSVPRKRGKLGGATGSKRTLGGDMATAHDVAAYILGKSGRMTAMKLQKLVYYSQAWHFVWDGVPLYQEEVQAWANGPVIYDLYLAHRGKYWVEPDDVPGPTRMLSSDEASSVDSVLETYGAMTAAQLSALTHSESPWVAARSGLAPTDRSKRTITLGSMGDYYGSLDETDEGVVAVSSLGFPDWLS